MIKRAAISLFVFAAALCFGGQAQAQHYVGIRGGYGSGTSNFTPPEDMGTAWGLYNGGVSWKFYTSEPFVGGVEIDAIYMQQGFRRYYTRKEMVGDEEREVRTGYYQRTVNSVMVPLFWQPHLYMFRQRMRVFANLGVTFSYNESSREKTVVYDTGQKTENDYEMLTTRDNRWGYGLCGGGGISWAAGRLETFVECRYYFGYSDILRNRNKYESNPLRSPLYGLQFSAGVFWRLGKGGIRSPQNRPNDETLKRIEERKMKRRDTPAKTEKQRKPTEESVPGKEVQTEEAPPVPQEESATEQHSAEADNSEATDDPARE
ncbi:PorT family protein [Alistipes sp. OttesenSCG-928-B03]|nr:PorT family protein [Alistipes sp. OttesenSCG-928-B03]